jgi:hypothetical protein
MASVHLQTEHAVSDGNACDLYSILEAPDWTPSIYSGSDYSWYCSAIVKIIS